MNIAERRKPSAPRDRQLIAGLALTDHGKGWVAFGMSMRCPDGASADFRAGYSEHREQQIGYLIAQGEAA